MASTSDSVWAIDLGQSSLKALHLALAGETPHVVAFDTIRHAKILSGKGISDLEREELIAMSLRQFVHRHEVGYDDIIVSVPSQNSFARFVNLPPVESKKIPEIVGFEAAQQIPFDMNEVQWDWQLMTDEDAPEKRVGLFAVKNEIVNAELERFDNEDLQVTHVQMTPMALYNYILYDRPDLLKSDSRPVVVLNIGAEGTDLVVCTPSGVWQRCILLGGNAFTQAISEAFKINFDKAEKLKRTAPVSKYARQIFQAMRPVFTDLAGEVQKSLGFYSSANPNAKFVRIIAMGGGTQLRGLLKYLQQTLQVPVERPDMFKHLALAPEVSAAKFHDSVPDFGIVYGLAIQVLGYGRIQSNLLPKTIARSMAWAMKIRMFMVAACVLLLVSALALGRTIVDSISYNRNEDVRRQVSATISAAKDAESRRDQERAKGEENREKIKEVISLFQYRDVMPDVYTTLLSMLPNAENNSSQRALYEAFTRGDIEEIERVPRKQRKQLFVTGLSISYAKDLETAEFGQINRPQDDTGEAAYAMESELAMMNMRGYGVTTPQQTEKTTAGFVVVMEGYSPYGDVGALLDPVGVGDQTEQWGFVTRLMNLAGKDPNDPNTPLVLFRKDKAEHFQIQKGFVDPRDKDMPYGVGAPREETAGPAMVPLNPNNITLVDPMTKEVISQEPDLEQRSGNPRITLQGRTKMKTHDSWFILKFKLQWNGAPEQKVTAPAAGAVGPDAWGYGP